MDGCLIDMPFKVSCILSPLYTERSHLSDGSACDVWSERHAHLLTKPGCPLQIRAKECINQLSVWGGRDTGSTAVCVIHTAWPVCDPSRLTVYDTMHLHSCTLARSAVCEEIHGPPVFYLQRETFRFILCLLLSPHF